MASDWEISLLLEAPRRQPSSSCCEAVCPLFGGKQGEAEKRRHEWETIEDDGDLQIF